MKMTTHSYVLSILIHSILGMFILMGIANATDLSNLEITTKIPTTGGVNVSESAGEGYYLDWMNQVYTDNESEYAVPIMTIIGFLPKIYDIYKKINSLMNPEAPKQTLEDVMKKITQDFSEVKNQLKAIEKKLSQQEVHVYHNVEKAVIGGINDLQFKSTINIEPRAVELYDQLNIFVNGMLGQSTVIPDLLATLGNVYECGSKSMYTTMERFVTLLNVGAVGISYYSKLINNKDKFDGDFRIQTLSDKKDAILQRLQKAMKECGKLERTLVNNYISKVLTLMQTSSTLDVTRALYERFDDIYYPRGISWVFYAVWEFKPTQWNERVATHIQVQSAYMLCWQCHGVVGEIKTGDWSVYWTGEPPRDTPVKPIKAINTDAVNLVVNNQKKKLPNFRHAMYIEQQLKPYNTVSSDSRYPVFWLFVVNPPSSATFGHPPADQQLNVLSYRYTTNWKFFHEVFPAIQFSRSVTVDMVVL